MKDQRYLEDLQRIRSNDKNFHEFTFIHYAAVDLSENIIEIANALQKNHFLKKLSIEVLIIKDHSLKILCEVLKTNHTLEELCLRQNKIGSESASYLAEMLTINSCLKKVSFWQSLTNEDAIIIAEAIEKNFQIIEFDLNDGTISNEIIERIQRRCGLNKCNTLAEMIRTNDPNFSTLSFMSSYSNQPFIDDAGLNILADALCANTTINRVLLIKQKFTDKGLWYLSKALEKNAGLKELILQENTLDNNSVYPLVEIIRTQKNLERLTITPITDEGIKVLSDALATNTTIKHLSLKCGKIADEGISSILTIVKTNAILKEIDLSGNAITVIGAKLLASVVLKTNSLIEINLTNNNIKESSIRHFNYYVRKNRLLQRLKDNDLTLTEVDLSYPFYSIVNRNPASSEEELKKYKGLTDEEWQTLLSALPTNNTIKKLSLEDNAMGEDAILTLLHALQANSSITDLYLQGNFIGNKGASVIAELIRKSTTLQIVRLDGNMGVYPYTQPYNNVTDTGRKELLLALKENHSVTDFAVNSSLKFTRSGDEYYRPSPTKESLKDNNEIKVYCLRNQKNKIKRFFDRLIIVVFLIKLNDPILSGLPLIIFQAIAIDLSKSIFNNGNEIEIADHIYSMFNTVRRKYDSKFNAKHGSEQPEVSSPSCKDSFSIKKV